MIFFSSKLGSGIGLNVDNGNRRREGIRLNALETQRVLNRSRCHRNRLRELSLGLIAKIFRIAVLTKKLRNDLTSKTTNGLKDRAPIPALILSRSGRSIDGERRRILVNRLLRLLRNEEVKEAGKALNRLIRLIVKPWSSENSLLD